MTVMDKEAEYARKTPSLLDLPFDAASSFMRGAAEAPSRIRQALKCDSSNMWTESGIDLGAEGAFHDSGYVQSGPLGGQDEMLELISRYEYGMKNRLYELVTHLVEADMITGNRGCPLTGQFEELVWKGIETQHADENDIGKECHEIQESLES